MNLFFSLFLLFLAIQAFRSPHWGLISLFGVLLLGNFMEDYLPFSYGTLIQTFGGISVLSLLINSFSLSGKNRIRLYSIHILLLIYIFYIVVSSPNTVFNDGDRNWFSTYFQLWLLMIVASNAIRNNSHLELLMKWTIIFNGMALALQLHQSSGTAITDLIYENNSAPRYYIISILFSYYFYRKSAKLIIRQGLLLVIGFFVFGLFITNSRTIFILLVLIGGYLLFKDFGWGVKPLAVSLIAALVVWLLIPRELMNYVISTFTGSAFVGKHGTGQFLSIQNNLRLLLWKGGLDMYLDHNILFGVGIGNFVKLISSYLPFSYITLGTHNTYLAVLFENGLLGFFIFMWMIIISTKNYSFRMLTKTPDKKLSIQFVWMLSYIIILLGGLTKHDHYNKLFFLFIGISTVFKYHFFLKSFQYFKHDKLVADRSI